MKSIKLLTLAFAGIFFTSFSFAQTVDEIVVKHIEAIGGRDNWKKVNSMRSEAILSTQGIEVPVIISSIHNKATKQEWSAMGMSGFTIITAEGGWMLNPMEGQTKAIALPDEQLKLGKEELDLQGEMLDYKEKGHTIQLMGNEDINASSCYKLKLTRKSGSEKIYFVDVKTSFIVRVVSKMSVGGQEVESVMNLSNYQKLELGIFVPFTMENSALPAPITMSKIEVNLKIEDAVFKVE